MYTARQPILVITISVAVLLLLARFSYLILIGTTKSCISGDHCFSSGIDAIDNRREMDPHLLYFYNAVFQDLIADGYLSPESKVLSVGTVDDVDIAAWTQFGVSELTQILPIRQSFKDSAFDLVFSGHLGLDMADEPAKFASEVSRTVKPGGFVVVHTTTMDSYSLNSLLDLFNSCLLVKSREINGLGSIVPRVHEIVLQKHYRTVRHGSNCSVQPYKRELIEKSEGLVEKEPSKKAPNDNIRYLPSMVDIRFKNRYVYIDVGARSYGSSIGSWFTRHYPKQNKRFEVYAIEPDKAFHEEYRSKENITLLPYAAWVRNETLFFEIKRDPSVGNDERLKRAGRAQYAHSSSNYVGDLNKIEGFDFADWIKNSVTERDFVVVRMDVEGSEFHLIPRLIETGVICLIDEMMVKCHYDRVKGCFEGKRIPKFRTTYEECLKMFVSLRKRGVLVHQWW